MNTYFKFRLLILYPLFMYCYYVSMYYLKDTYLIILNVFFIIFWVMLRILQLQKSRNSFLDLLFWHLTFRQETYRDRHLITAIFQHENILTWVYFGIMDVLAQGCYGTGIFWHNDISAHGRFGTCTFWHCVKQYIHFGTVLKFPCAKMSMFHNVLVW